MADVKRETVMAEGKGQKADLLLKLYTKILNINGGGYVITRA